LIATRRNRTRFPTTMSTDLGFFMFFDPE